METGLKKEQPSLNNEEIEQDSNWVLTYNNYSPEEEKQREALSAIGNGYFVTRAAQPQSTTSNFSYPGTYLAGLYNRAKTNLNDQVEENEDLVNLPNWLPVSISINDSPEIDINKVEIISYQHSLNLKEGILYKQIRIKDDNGQETEILEKRLVHMRHFHLAAQEIIVNPINWSGKLSIMVGIDGRIENKGVYGYRFLNGKHLVSIKSSFEDNTIHFKSSTSQSNVVIAQSTRTKLSVNDSIVEPTPVSKIEDSYISQTFHLDVTSQDKIKIEKVCSLYTSRDWGISEPGEQAKEAVKEAKDFDSLLDDQVEEWQHLWNKFDLELEIDGEDACIPIQLVLRLHSFHVLQTASPNSIDLDCGIPARGWTGEAYRGHIFWDDLFVFPFLNLRMPEITQSLLRYRYRRLEEARKLAIKLGANGARFPWESASSGKEETPKLEWNPVKNTWTPVRTNLQIHVNAAIAYNIWQYYQVTGDLHSIHAYGAEMLFEIARFFASFTSYNSKTDRYEIHGVAGPDEFHQAYPGATEQGINNNAYTNVMAAWTLARALDLYESLPGDHRFELSEKLDLTVEEINKWEKVSRRLYVPWHNGGIINQFDGYEELEEFPYKKDGQIDSAMLSQKLLEQGGNLNQYKVSKQADVLMLFYVFSAEELEEIFERLGYPFPLKTIPANISYYMQHTINHSTLSRVSHAWVLSRLDRPRSWRILSEIFPSDDREYNEKDHPENNVPESWSVFLEALGSDYNDIQGGTTPEGIHMGAMAGTIDIIQRAYTGIVTRDDVLWFNPYLPKDLKSLAFNIHYRSQSLRFTITQDTVTVEARHSSAQPVSVGFLDKVYSIKSGEKLKFSITKGSLVSS